MTTLNRSRLTAKMLLEIDAISFNIEKPFSLSSGFLSPSYIDCRKVISYPKIRTKIIELMTKTITEKIGEEVIQYIIGGETAGIPFGTLIAEKLDLPMSYVRKKAKKYGKSKVIEGEILIDKECLLIEDLMTDGKSKIDFLLKIREHNISCRHGLVLFNYDIFPETKSRLKEHDIEMHYLATWKDVYDELISSARFESSITRQIKRFIDNPIEWSASRKNLLIKRS